MKTVRLAVSLLTFSDRSALAQQPPAYLDNRSDAAELVRSLYNAINGANMPAPGTISATRNPPRTFRPLRTVMLKPSGSRSRLATISKQGATGSIFYSVPVAIRAIAKTAAKACSPAAIWRDLSIRRSRTRFSRRCASKTERSNPQKVGCLRCFPPSCGERPRTQTDAQIEAVKKRFSADYSGICQTLEPTAEAGDSRTHRRDHSLPPSCGR